MRPNDYYDPLISAQNDNRSAQVIQVEQGKSLSVIALVMSVAALIGLFIEIFMGGQLMDAKAKAAAANAVVRSDAARQSADLARHDIQTIQVELNKHGIDIPVN